MINPLIANSKQAPKIAHAPAMRFRDVTSLPVLFAVKKCRHGRCRRFVHGSIPAIHAPLAETGARL